MSPCSRADKKFLVLPVSMSSVPEETQRVQESGTQRAGRGAVILRLPVQHLAVGLQGECSEGVANTQPAPTHYRTRLQVSS